MLIGPLKLTSYKYIIFVFCILSKTLTLWHISYIEPAREKRDLTVVPNLGYIHAFFLFFFFFCFFFWFFFFFGFFLVCPKLPQGLYYMSANSKSSGETALKRRLAWAFAGRLCNRYPFLTCWPILSHRRGLPIDRCRHKEKGQPLCMEQYYRLFKSYRVPGLMKDSLILNSTKLVQEPEHVIVVCRNQVSAVEYSEPSL